MRILSRFRDYYDNAQAHGQDERLVLVRTTLLCVEAFRYGHSRGRGAPLLLGSATGGCSSSAAEQAEVRKDFAWMLELSHLAPVNLSFTYKRQRWALSAAWALVGGLFYPYAVLQRDPESLWGAAPSTSGPTADGATAGAAMQAAASTAQYFHDVAELTTQLGAMGQSFDPARSHAFSWMRSSRLSWQAYFALQGSDRWLPSSLRHRIALANWSGQQDVLQIGAVRLANFELYRVLHPVQAHQSLAQFLANLAAPERDTVQVGHDDRLRQHGFDEWSFRKPPEPQSVKKRTRNSNKPAAVAGRVVPPTKQGDA